MALVLLLYYLLRLLQIALLVYVIASWIRLPPDNPIVRILDMICEPLLAPIRQVLPSMGGMDLSPLVAFFVLGFLQNLVVRLAY